MINPTTMTTMEDTAVLIARIDQLNAEAWSILKEERERARALSREAAELATTGPFAQNPYKRGLAESLRTLSRAAVYSGNYEHSLSQALEALSLLEEENLPALMGEVLYTIAVNYVTLGNLSAGLDSYMRQLEVVEQIGDKEGYAMALLGLGNLYAEMNDYASAQSYNEQSLAVFRELPGQSYWVALLLNNICYNYFQQGDYQKALAWGEEGLTFCKLHGNTRIEAVISNSIAEVYLQLNDLDKALHYLETAVAVANKGDDAYIAIESLKLSGEIYFKQGRAAQALPFVQQSLLLAEQANHKRWIFACHRLLADIYRALGLFAEALTHFEQFHAIKETVQSEEVNEKLKNLEIVQRTLAAQKEAELYASLYQEEQARRVLAETMQRVGAALTGSIELKEVLDTILAQLALLVPYDRGSLLVRRGNELEFMAMRGFPEGEGYLHQRISLDADPDSPDVFMRIYHSRRPLALVNLAGYEGWQQVSNLTVPGAWLGIPLIHRDEVRGMLSLVREANVPYDEEAIALATTFGDTAVVALENARLYHRTRRFNEQLEYEVRQRTQALQDAYEQLERLDKAKADFIAVTAHELRTPITVMKAYSQLLQKKGDTTGGNGDDNLVAGIVSGANRLHEIVTTMLWMVKIDSKALEIFPEPLNMVELIGHIVRGLSEDIAIRKQRVIVDDSLMALPSITGDEDALKVVFANIIVNAIKYTPDGGEIRIHGRAWDTPPQPDLPTDAIAITVSDSGIGIALEAQELIFTKFYQTGDVALHSSGKTKFKGGGPGLGLAIARGIIEAHHGRLWAESPGHDEKTYPGSHFHIVLPRTQPTRITT
ncbi:MAG TPA: tetratricopeptide repeat protein [Chloroflexota bacterium]|nr:tetratricopeptide repeat protein [Chloroflexota bacterium]